MNWTEFNRGMWEGLPFLAGAIPFSMVLGVAAADLGLSATLTISHSAIIFAGTAQAAVLELIRAGATMGIILLTTLVINLRMMMYSATLAPQFKSYSLFWRMVMSFVLIDQVFAFSVIRLQNEPDISDEAFKGYYLGVATPVSLFWIIGTALGVYVGAIIPSSWGLDFAIPLTLLAVAVPALKSRPSVVAAVVGGGLAVFGFQLPHNLGLLIGAIMGMIAGLLIEMWQERPV